MSQTRPPRQPAILDPYVSVERWAVGPPQLPDPTSDPHVLTIRVPQPERTTLELGAGAVPGIRMETGTHVHLTAREPKTTISLGANGGPGVEGVPPGLAINTEGQLTELVVGDARKTFESDLSTVILGDSTWQCDANRAVIVYGNSVDMRHKNQRTEIEGAYTLSSGARTETVKGDYLLLMPRHKHTATVKDMDLTVLGDLREDVKGTVTRTVGKSDNVHLGANAAVYLGANVSHHVGLKLEASLALHMGVHQLKVEQAGVNVTRRALSVERSTMRVVNHGMNLAEMKTGLTKVDLEIKRAGLFILK